MQALVIEDTAADFELVERHLQRRLPALASHWVDRRSALAAALAERVWDIVLADYLVPGLDFSEALAMLREAAPDTPVILLTGHLDEEEAGGLLRQGVWDFVLKDRLVRLVPVIERCLQEGAERRARRAAEAALRVSEQRLRSILDNAASIIWVKDPAGRFQVVNQHHERLTGWPADQVLGRTVFDLYPPEQAAAYAANDQAVLDSGTALEAEETLLLGGERRVLLANKFPIRDADGRLEGLGAICADITGRNEAEAARRELETQLLQAQKMEAIGRLAGGVAHDFNNRLHVILGNCDLLSERLPVAGDAAACLQQIREAAERSRQLARQMLAFSRQQPIAPAVIDVDERVTAMERLLRRVLDAEIELTVRLGATGWHVLLDPAQLDLVVTNLVVNARDAMPGGGTLVVETGRARLEATQCQAHAGVDPGEYVSLFVTDTGCGMDEATRARAFEPFFTSKPEGQGTGLGLATVYGVVSQNRGMVELASAPGQGTSVRIFLPRCEGAPVSAPAALPELPTPSAGQRTLLLVEDQAPVRLYTRRCLTRLGYEVVEAESPLAALDLLAAHPGSVDVMLTDIGLPTMNGRTLAERARALRPELRVVFMSGYQSDVFHDADWQTGDVHFLQKPFTKEELAGLLVRVLES